MFNQSTLKRLTIKQALLLIATTLLINGAIADTEKAIFGGGCFWCMEPPFDKQEGVITTISGYIGGHIEKPSYQDVSSGQSGHVEVVEVTYNPDVVSYDKLLKIYWVNIDPINSTGQFCDRGSQYLSAIFYLNENQRIAAEGSLKALKTSKVLNGKIATTIRPASTFYPAEEYHQDYYQKNSLAYRFYRYKCGRDARIKEIWPHTPES